MLRRMMMAESAAPPPVTGFDTSMLTGRTFVFSPYDSAMFKGAQADAGSPANGETVPRIDSAPGPSSIRTLWGGGQFTYLDSMFGPGLKGLRYVATTFSGLLYTRPTGNNPPASNRPTSDLFAAGQKLIIFAGTIYDASANRGSAYLNDMLLADNSGYCGLHYYKSGSNIVLQWMNYTSGEVVRTATVPAGAPFVIACRHSGSSLGVSVNNGAWATTGGSGNTGSLADYVRAFEANITASVAVAALVTCNNANTNNANVAAACTSAGKLVGLTI